MELTEIGRRIHERDTTLDLPGIALDLIAQITALQARVAGLQADVHASQGEVTDRDQRLERSQLTITRQGAVLEILRQQLRADLSAQRIVQTALDAFDAGRQIIPG